jgi:uncharacterized protein (DUF2236 family)
MITMQISLPDDVAKKSNQLGLLESHVLAEILSKEIRQRAFSEILALADKLAATGDVPMSEEEIQAEIRAARAEKRANRT